MTGALFVTEKLLPVLFQILLDSLYLTGIRRAKSSLVVDIDDIGVNTKIP